MPGGVAEVLQQLPGDTYGLERAVSSYRSGDWQVDTNYGVEDLSYAMEHGASGEPAPEWPHDPVLDVADIEALDDLDAAVARYQAEGVDAVETPFDAYAHLKDDWWTQVRADDFPAPTELPGSETALQATDPATGDIYAAVLNTHGVNHGQQHDKIDEPVRDFIQDYLANVHDRVDARTYVEQGLDEAVLDTDDGDHDELIEVNDQHALADELEREFGRRFQLKTMLGLLLTSQEEYRASSMDDTLRDTKLEAIADATERAGEDPAGIADLQNAIRAYQLPYHLEQDYVRHVEAGLEDEIAAYEDEINDLVGSFTGKLDPRNWYRAAQVEKERRKTMLELRVMSLGFDAEYRRSEIIAETALEALFDAPIEEIHAIVGAKHWPEIEEYAEHLDNDELLALRPDTA